MIGKLRLSLRCPATWIAAIVLALSPFSAGAEEPLGTAGYLAIAIGSKLRYDVGTGPVKNPVESANCGRRDANLKRSETDGNVHLVGWGLDEKALGHIREAEKFFRSHDLDKAEIEYKACLALQPGYGAGWLCLGDVPFGRKDYAAALEDYRKAIEIDPSLAQAHRFAADALAHLGKYAEAEEEYINAVAWDPAYLEAWQALKDLGKSVGFTVEGHPFQSPAGLLGSGKDGSVQIGIPEGLEGGEATSTRWLAYATCKAVWRFEPGFRERHGAKAGSKYELSSAEEQECLATYIEGALNYEDGERSKRKQPKLEFDALAASAPGDVGLLYRVLKAGMLNEYILFEDMGRVCPSAVSLFPGAAIERVKAYLRKFVVTHPGPAPGGAVGSP